ncbi:hypothetical protein GPJ56_004791 [Histomonas meleagridis]|uniref:uncharacterized protein n=1 Tax=Histomonas meleagridis TaxID=135588 RepID=UPI00355A7CC8|nr:hypothetical protein GPJ56_004791 [Histomonas meleagridis]KAH0801689.1 hypothetical protein GO595_005524 [Histomonas meleagridis]
MKKFKHEWNGPTAIGFDEDEQNEIIEIRRKLRKALSRRRSRLENIQSLQQKQNYIENRFNQNLMTLDLHSAALKYDKRKLHGINIGIAEYLVDSSFQIKEFESESRGLITKNKEKLKQLEEKKKADFQNDMKPLEKELQQKRQKAEELEAEARSLDEKARQKQRQMEQYKEYQEWVSLSNEYNRLCDEAIALERSLPKEKSISKPMQRKNLHTRFFD